MHPLNLSKKNKVLLAHLIGLIYFIMYLYWINKYPIVWGDSPKYIRWGFQSELQTYGSSFYPIFIKYSSLGISLWFVVTVQWLFASYILYRTIYFFFPEKSLTLYLISLGVLLSSSLPFFAGTILTGIFLPIGILANFLIYNHKIEFKEIFLYAIFIICVLGHNGFGYIFILLNIFYSFIFILRKNSRKQYLKNSFFALVLSFFAIGIVKPLVHLCYEKDMRHDRGINFYSRQMYLIANSGLQKDFLSYACKENNTSPYCQGGVSKKYFSKEILLWSNDKDLEAQCKVLFYNAFGNSAFLKIYFFKKWDQLKKMFLNLKKSGGSTGTKWTVRITNFYFPNDWIGIEDSNKFSKKKFNGSFLKQNNFFLIKSAWYIIFIYIIFTILTSQLERYKLYFNSDIFLLIHFVMMGIFFSLLFYCIFSRAQNARYPARLGWLIIFVSYLILCQFIKKIKKPSKKLVD